MVEGDGFVVKRLMRLRGSQHLRDLCAETEFNRAQLIQPLFVVEGLGQDEPIAGLSGNVRHRKRSCGWCHTVFALSGTRAEEGRQLYSSINPRNYF
jgi:delta-aminolevulinic acid dehydratase/porphobilinogen synthase